MQSSDHDRITKELVAGSMSLLTGSHAHSNVPDSETRRVARSEYAKLASAIHAYDNVEDKSHYPEIEEEHRAKHRELLRQVHDNLVALNKMHLEDNMASLKTQRDARRAAHLNSFLLKRNIVRGSD